MVCRLNSGGGNNLNPPPDGEATVEEELPPSAGSMCISMASGAWCVEEVTDSYDLSSGIRYDMILSTGRMKAMRC
jgi:hypothetical protein